MGPGFRAPSLVSRSSDHKGQTGRVAHAAKAGSAARRAHTPPVSEVVRAQTRSLGDPRQHTRADLLTGAERKHVLRPTATRKDLVRSRGAFDAPPDTQQGRQNAASLDGWPSAHAAANWMVFGLGEGSPCSSRSATTRSANAFARLAASSRLSPYAMTPGSSMISAIQRPSSSRSVSIVNRICLGGSVRRETLATPRTGTCFWLCGRGESTLLAGLYPQGGNDPRQTPEGPRAVALLEPRRCAQP